jgi:hypothetical protein
MKYLAAAAIAALAAWAPLAGLARQTPQKQSTQTQQQQLPTSIPQQPQTSPAPTAPPPALQTIGKVGDTDYAWTNGYAWFSLDENSRIALVVGIEQGVVLSVRENWNAVPKGAQQAMVKTAGQITVSGFPFDHVVEQIDGFYLDASTIEIPVVDAYLYTIMKLKNAPPDELKNFLDKLRKTYKAPEAPAKPPEKP